jgi:hypothetical protein
VGRNFEEAQYREARGRPQGQTHVFFIRIFHLSFLTTARTAHIAHAHLNTHTLQAVYDSGIRAVAVVLMHSYTFHEHEALVGQVAAKIGFGQISLSHEVMSMFRIVPR